MHSFKIAKFLVCLIGILFCISSFGSDPKKEINVKDIKNLIKIPIIRQGTNYSCGSAVLQSILLYYYKNEREYQWLCEDTLIKELNTTSESGTNYGQIVSAASKRGLHVEVKFHMSVDSLKNAIDKRRLVICNIQAWSDKPPVNYEKSYDEGHYVVAIGYDEKNIYFMDSWTAGNYTYIPIKELLARWHDTNIDDSGKVIKTENLGIVLWRDSRPEFNPDVITKIE